MENNGVVKSSLRSVAKHINEYWLNDVSFVLLLIVLIFTVFVLPVLIEYGHVNMFFVNMVFIFLFFAGIWSSDNKFLILLTTFLFLCQLALRILRFSSLPVEFYLLERIFGLFNMGAFIFVNFRLLFRNHEVNFYRVIGAVNVYLLVSILGAFGFEVIHLLLGSSISGINELVQNKQLSGLDEDFSTYIYFSLVSLTTVGFGDYTPVNVMSKMLAVFLSTIGILYPAVVIAKLVGYSTTK
ncbi:potassium channel family protein [Algoriphagus sp. AK58]|uniref:potassium channel family protein n=1 Tax=Algoriphagus sp. AK58 TaxID=1406877 RepID=UPI001650ACC6|nr:potassium channel family protein [Algoriphagus sp. AK58]MBC6367800.1 two pore domain potassium channel family protein [Algoriphagus sp. AK58]